MTDLLENNPSNLSMGLDSEVLYVFVVNITMSGI